MWTSKLCLFLFLFFFGFGRVMFGGHLIQNLHISSFRFPQFLRCNSFSRFCSSFILLQTVQQYSFSDVFMKSIVLFGFYSWSFNKTENFWSWRASAGTFENNIVSKYSVAKGRTLYTIIVWDAYFFEGSWDVLLSRGLYLFLFDSNERTLPVLWIKTF